MTKEQKQAFKRWWTRMVNSGIPLSQPFELAVVHAHAELAYLAGIRAERRKAKKRK